MRRLLAGLVVALALGGCGDGNAPTLDEHICAELADGKTQWEVATDLAYDVDGDDSLAAGQEWLRAVKSAAPTC